MQQKRDAQRDLHAEAAILYAVERRVPRDGTRHFCRNDEFCRVQMQEFAIQAEEAIDVQRQLYSLTFLAGAQKRLIRTLPLLSSPVGTTLSFGTLLDRSQK